ncbi:calmodulin-binding protein [Pelomyxa schiedti]|nr:calmodulin-binding protein [Pelomyxa schiedti]
MMRSATPDQTPRSELITRALAVLEESKRLTDDLHDDSSWILIPDEDEDDFDGGKADADAAETKTTPKEYQVATNHNREIRAITSDAATPANSEPRKNCQPEDCGTVTRGARPQETNASATNDEGIARSAKGAAERSQSTEIKSPRGTDSESCATNPDFDCGSRISSLLLSFVGTRPPGVPSAIQPPEKSTVHLIHSKPQEQEHITPPVESHPDPVLREKSVLELTNTEAAYVYDLGIVVHTVIPPIRSQEILTQSQIYEIFCNLETIYGFHKVLLGELYDTSIGECFVKMCQYLKLYSVYLANQQRQSDTINTLLKTNKQFEKFYQDLSRRPEMRRLDLLSFLIKPLQRLCQYPLLLKEIIKHSPTDNGDYPLLLQAHAKISTIVESINEFARKQDNQLTLWKLHADVTDENGAPIDLVIPSRRLTKYGTLTEHVPCGILYGMIAGNTQEVQYLLFNDVLLRAQGSVWSSKLVMKSLTPLNCLAVLTVADTTKESNGIPLDKHCIWLEGYYSKDQSITPLWQATLIFSTLPDRDSWFNAITTAICEYTPLVSSYSSV